MLSNIINQIQKERARDRVISTQTGTNQRHDHITNIPGHRKVSQNSFFSMVPLVKASTFTEKSPAPTPAAEPTTAAEPEPTTAAEPTAAEPTTAEPTTAEPAEPTTAAEPANNVIPKGMSRAAIRKKQREEELAKKRQQKEAAAAAAVTAAPEPTLIEIESTVSQ